MQYEKRCLASPGTTKAAPAKFAEKVVAGVITRVAVEFPKGCAGLVGVRFHVNEARLYPTNPDDWFISDGEVIEFPARFPIDATPATVRLLVYNLDDTYPHAPIVRWTIEEALIVSAQDITGAMDLDRLEVL